MTILEQFIAGAWNRLVSPGRGTSEPGPRLDLGFQVVDDEVRQSHAYTDSNS